MKKFDTWKKEQSIEDFKEVALTKEEFLEVCKEYFGVNLRGSLKTYSEHKTENLTEAAETSRYSVEVNYRTTAKEVLEGFAKLSLGYVSAALKNFGFHTRHVFTEKPLRLLVSSRNWDDGTITGLISWNPDHNCFVISKGFYNKERKTVSVQSSKKFEGESAADIAKNLHNMMHQLKNEPDKFMSPLKPVNLKRGPKN